MHYPHEQTASQPGQTKSTPLRDLLSIPLGCLIRTPLLLVLVGLALFGSWIAYTQFNWDLFGITAPPYGEWNISQGFTSVTRPDGKTWKITYETHPESTFSGLVRHVTPIRESRFPLLSHDILVTRGDYANSDMVATSVSNHHFSWYAFEATELTGTINLLHTIPESEEIYLSLLNLRKGDQIIISGREIKTIVFYQQDGRKIATWMDTGCNTLLVSKVEILPKK